MTTGDRTLNNNYRIKRALALLLLLTSTAPLAQPLQIPVLYLHWQPPVVAVMSNTLPPPADEGLRGAELGISDNNTTGRFLLHNYSLEAQRSEDSAALLQRALDWVAGGNGLIIANLPAATLSRLAQHPQIAGRAIIFNAGSSANQLRTSDCRSGLLHTLPSRAMLTDALTQFLVRKRWNRWLHISGPRPEDQLYSQSLRRSAQRFGATIIDSKTWSFSTDLRRMAQQEIPAFTRAKDHHVVVVADELGDFGEYLPYNTWLPRPVAGTQGLVPSGWHHSIEQWGASQLQRRFSEHAGRWMNDKDYAAWLAVRVIGEAVTRSGSDSAATVYAYLLGEQFQIAAFKGRKLSFRDWNGQLRQPIALVQPNALVSQSPQEGFLHPLTELDTLGYDRPESSCDFATTLPPLQAAAPLQTRANLSTLNPREDLK
ncbi:ABC transporter substrate-binding protein [Pseudomaricurvus alcaniphilus]|nr:ABC transporter substrate-binding protein [Pseudomaricurvus alcaniphilus]